MTCRERSGVSQLLLAFVVGAAAGLPGNLAAADKLVAPFTEREALAARAAWAKELNVEPIMTNKIGMQLALIPPGEFQMGSPSGKAEPATDETQHRVRITQPYFLGVYEVTQREWEDVMGSQPSWFSRSGDGKDKVSGQDTSRFPVESVSWEDATEFCRKLSQREGNTYRLPTEAEWEYACRAGTTTVFHFGNALNGNKANVDGNFPYGTTIKGKSQERTARVGSYGANAFGLYDMSGNVWEWCRDWYDEEFYSRAATDDPENTTQAASRVLRGGSWANVSWNGHSAGRYKYTPDLRSSVVGFRVLCLGR